MPVFQDPSRPVKDLSKAIALISSGSIVPRETRPYQGLICRSYGAYGISELRNMTPENYESYGGYDREWANVDPDVIPSMSCASLRRGYSKIIIFYRRQCRTAVNAESSAGRQELKKRS